VNWNLLAMSRELQRNLPQTLGELRLTQWWCFSYDPKLPGTDIHGDDADISLNLWLTPDSANAAPGSGGLEVWDTESPGDWSFDQMNSDGDRIRNYLARVGARRQHIPYRENRAVLFKGRLFHKSDPADFKRGFGNRRRNLTLLYRNLMPLGGGLDDANN
jgi:hypothetical protein